MNLKAVDQKSESDRQPVTGGLAVRTNLRAGFSLDELGNQAKALLEKLTNAVSSAPTNSTPTTSTTA